MDTNYEEHFDGEDEEDAQDFLDGLVVAFTLPIEGQEITQACDKVELSRLLADATQVALRYALADSRRPDVLPDGRYMLSFSLQREDPEDPLEREPGKLQCLYPNGELRE